MIGTSLDQQCFFTTIVCFQSKVGTESCISSFAMLCQGEAVVLPAWVGDRYSIQ